MAARSAVNRKVGGSSPPRSVKFFATFLLDFVLGLPVVILPPDRLKMNILKNLLIWFLNVLLKFSA